MPKWHGFSLPWHQAMSVADTLLYEIEIPADILNQLVATRQAIKSTIAHVPFAVQQYWFDTGSFAVLNAQAMFRPWTGREPLNG